MTLAGPEKILDFVSGTFPQIRKVHLEGYQIEYSKSRRFFTGKILTQIPKILHNIRREHQWLERLLANEHFDLVISDNRYGLHHSACPCVIMTHQLMIKSGWGKVVDRQLQKLHYRLLQRFNNCWVVDEPDEGNCLSGELAHPEHLPINVSYIGILSQMVLYPNSNNLPQAQKGNPEVLVLLSGPEPMRSQLEAALLPQCLALTKQYHFHFVAGNIHSQPEKAASHNGLAYFPKLSASELAPLLQKADLVICRSGYSTLMDLAVLRKKALLIPTPGQTEQEYLAQYLCRKYDMVIVRQNQVNLAKDILLAIKKRAISLPAASKEPLKSAMDKALK